MLTDLPFRAVRSLDSVFDRILIIGSDGTQPE